LFVTSNAASISSAPIPRRRIVPARLMFIDPYLSMLTDELVEGKVDHPYFRRSIVWLTGSRIVVR
jgi:hypothetical protein